MKRLALPTISLALAAVFASGCVYKMSIQQGNYLVADSVAQLKEGMTRSQVRPALGKDTTASGRFHHRALARSWFHRLTRLPAHSQREP